MQEDTVTSDSSLEEGARNIFNVGQSLNRVIKAVGRVLDLSPEKIEYYISGPHPEKFAPDNPAEKVLPRESELRIMDPEKGDLRLAWNGGAADPHAGAREANAREAFLKAQKKGNMIFYRTNFDGSVGAAIKEFDPEAERIIGVPFPVGG